MSLLEIGVGGYEKPQSGGGSLRLWRSYFPFSRIYALDINDKSPHEERRIKIFQGSQSDPAFLKEVVAKTGPLDVVIDDGSHFSNDVITSFEFLFPQLKSGGVYVIEDTQTSYWNECGGNMDKAARTTMNYFRNLVDGLNYEEFPIPRYEPTYLEKNIVSIHFYHNIIFIEKGENTKGSNVLVNNTMPSS
jgi:demethylmacrocin O-methyltransferase